MVKRLRACVAMLACVVPLVGPGVAHAGCTAIAGASAFDPSRGAIASHHGISCTTSNGSHYQVREYLQADNGGWHTTTPSITIDVYSPPDNYSKLYVAYWQCNSTYMPPAANYVRSKTVVENVASASTSVAYGPILAIPSGC